MDEIWKDIPRYKGYYQASSLGRVRSISRIGIKGIKVEGKVIAISKNKKTGYCSVTLGIDGKVETPLLHRIIAETFIPNPNNYPQVNHKDENKSNNCVENLEWCTSKYNMNYGTRTARVNERKHKPVNMYSLETDKFIMHFDSLDDAAKFVHGKSCNIAANCQWKSNSSYGYRWSWCYGSLRTDSNGKSYVKGLTKKQGELRCKNQK